MLKRFVGLGMLLATACSAEVIKDDDNSQLERGEGGYLGTGASGREEAVRSACDELVARLPNCDYDICTKAGHDTLEGGELSGCTAEAVEFFYCQVDLATQQLCLGHQACEDLWKAYDHCWLSACAPDPKKCGAP